MNRKLLVSMACIAAAALAVGCWICLRILSKSHFEVLAEEVCALTVPTQATAVTNSEIVSGNYSIRVHWEFEIDWDWEKYRPWVKQQLEGRFTVVSDSPREIVFTQSLPGDTLHLTIENLGERPLRIRITFVGTAT